jgi:hypothetical protein
MRTRTIVVIVVVSFLVIACISLGIVGMQTPVQAQEDTSEDRIASLEARIVSLEQDALYLRRQYNDLNSQVRAWIVGEYIAYIHSSSEYQIYFEDSLLGTVETDVSYGSLPTNRTVLVMEVGEVVVDRVDLGGIVQPGDLLIAWRDDGVYDPQELWPSSPDWWHVWSYYWNSETQLAVGIIRIDGGSQGGVIVR